MRLRGVHRLLIALAIVPLVGGAAFAAGTPMFVCQGDRVARSTCCCPRMEKPSPAPSPVRATVRAGCCCDLSQATAPVALAAEVRAASQVVEPFALTPALGAVVAAPVPVGALVARKLAHAPPPAIPILLSKQSFLV